MAQNSNAKTSSAKSAPIIRQGQTASGNFGDDPNLRSKSQKPVRDLRAK